MAAHRYWKVLCVASGDSNGYFGFYEVQLRTAIGGANVATGGTASFTGRLFSGTASLAFNGSLTDGFILNGYDSGQGSIIYDFGAGNEKDIVEVGIAPRNDGFFFQCVNQGGLYYSDDGSTYTKAFDWSVASWAFVSEMRYFAANLSGSYFDHGRKTAAANIALTTSSRLIASFGGAGSIAVNRPCAAPTYAEFTITTMTGTPVIGLVNQAFAFSSGLLGADANTLGYRSGGAVVSNGVTLATIQTFANGDRVDVAFDAVNQLIWFRVNGGNWNNNAANDPTTLTGGISIPTTSTNNLGTATLAAGASITGTVIAAALDTFVGTPPTGYQSITSKGSKPTKTTQPSVAGAAAYQGPTCYTPVKATDNKPNQIFSGIASVKYVGGVIRELGATVSGRIIHVYDRDTGELISQAKSDGSGVWQAPGVGRISVRVVASDPTTYNSLALDNVAPA